MMQGFLLGQGASPDDYATRRAMIQAMMPQFGSARTIGEGLGQLFTGIGLGRQQTRLDREEAAAKQGAMDQFNALLSSGGTAQPGGFSILGQAPVTPGQGVANDTMAALGYGGPMGKDAVVSGLVQRGIPQHIAEGFAMNFVDESGMNTTALGDNGNAYGLAQWNGPRKAALEAYAAKTGKPASDMNTQLDFLVSELQGGESAAWGQISAAKTPQEAAVAVLNAYERPAEQHRQRREAQYSTAQLAAAANNPLLPADMRAAAQQLLTEQTAADQLAMKQQDPLYQQQLAAGQLGLQKDQLELAQMMQPQPGYRVLTGAEAAQMGLPAGTWQMAPDGQITAVQGREAAADPVAQLDARARAAGLVPGTPEYQTFMLRNGSVADQGRALSIIWGRDAQGNPIPMQASPDGTLVPSKLPDGVTPLDPAAKSYETALGAGMGKNAAEAQNLLPASQIMVDKIDQQVNDLLSDPELPNMLGWFDSKLPDWFSSDRVRVRAKMAQLQGGAFLQAREMLKGGGAITDFEGRKAEEAFVRMQSAQTPEDFRAAVEDFRAFTRQGLLKLQQQAVQNPGQRYTGAQPYGGADVPPAPPGIDPADWQYMTPEERALFK